MPLQKTIHDQIGNAGTEGGLVSFQCFHCDHHLIGSVGLENSPANTHFQTVSNHILGAYVGDHQYSLGRIIFQNLSGGIEAIMFWHADIPNEKVWFQLLALLHRVLSVGRLPADYPSFTGTKQ
jgi:hypothetical protein